MSSGQHHISSFVEVVVSNVLSFFIDLAFIAFAAPYIGLNLHFPALTAGLLVLYAIHIFKSYLYRRFCNYLMLKGGKNDKAKLCDCGKPRK